MERHLHGGASRGGSDFPSGLHLPGQKSLQLDQFPFREDVVDNARTSIRFLKALHRALDSLDKEALARAQARQDSLAAQRLVQDALLGCMARD